MSNLAHAHEFSPEPLSNGSPKTRPSRILVVDDELGFRALLTHELEKRGYKVTTANNGEEALQKARQGKFDLAISDMKMPKLSGVEFLEAIKKEIPDIEVILATGFGTIETAVDAMKKGAYDFVQKPFNLPEVFVLVEKALEKKDLRAILGVYEASKAIFSSIKLEKLLPTIMQLTLKILKADDASIMLRKEDGSLSLESCVGLDNDERKEARLAIGERVAGKATQVKEPFVISGPLESDDRFRGVPKLREIHSSIVYPLEIEGESLGVLNVNRTGESEPFSSSDLRTATIFGSQIAQAVYNARLYQELEGKVSELKNAYSQLESMQLQLVQSEKLAAIGQLAAGVAHELNNPLTGILGFSQMVLESPDLSKQVREDIESVYKQSQRCRQIIQNLLQFSRRKESQKDRLMLVPLIESTLKLVRYDFSSSNIEIVTEFSEPLSPIFGDASQLEQVLLNLVNNARHAMEKRSPAQLTIKAFQKGSRVTLQFIDTGCGISKENLKKVFDPFFTTKPAGKGTGLGLSISYGIVQQHHGTIAAESQEGVGTTFTLEFPAYAGESHEQQNDTHIGR